MSVRNTTNSSSPEAVALVGATAPHNKQISLVQIRPIGPYCSVDLSAK